jgi:RHS repeat-associated protein
MNHPSTISKITYPFGMNMPGRSFSSGSYIYGFQGQEKDDEIKGDGNSINYKYRVHDTRLGQFLSVDPLARDYPQWSAYVFSGNQIIATRELEGLEPIWVQDMGNWFKNLPDQGPFQNKKLNKYYNQNIYGPDNQKRIFNSKEFKIAKDVTIIVGGIVTTIASGGTATGPYIAAFGITTGIFAIGAGGGKLGLDMQGKTESSKIVPTSPLGAFGLVVDQVVQDDEISYQSLGEIANGFILLGTANYEKFDALNVTDKLLTLRGIIDGIYSTADKQITTDDSIDKAQELLNIIELEKSTDDD